ncbi:hypothetical protein MYX64_04230 [Nitrospinae bacterium AH_259_B05_G02_I21]|nr:hypothetical protein [Nitrospinae bacterium AH_259_B05_G02_I21]
MAPRTAAGRSSAYPIRHRSVGLTGWAAAFASLGGLAILVSLPLPPAALPADDELRRTPVVKAVERVGPAVVNISTHRPGAG